MPGLVGPDARWQTAARMHERRRSRHGDRHQSTRGTITEPRLEIVGGEPAGVCAENLVLTGIRPTVIDEGRRNGGQTYRRQQKGFTRLKRRAPRVWTGALSGCASCSPTTQWISLGP